MLGDVRRAQGACLFTLKLLLGITIWQGAGGRGAGGAGEGAGGAQAAGARQQVRAVAKETCHADRGFPSRLQVAQLQGCLCDACDAAPSSRQENCKFSKPQILVDFCRDAFRELLAKHRAEGIINAATRWKASLLACSTA